jgi:hypothetical protein
MTNDCYNYRTCHWETTLQKACWRKTHYHSVSSYNNSHLSKQLFSTLKRISSILKFSWVINITEIIQNSNIIYNQRISKMNAVFKMYLIIARTFFPSVRIWVLWYEHGEVKSLPVKTISQTFESKMSCTEPETAVLGWMMKKTKGKHSTENFMILNFYSSDCLLWFYVSILFPQNGNLPQIRMFVIQYLCSNTI